MKKITLIVIFLFLATGLPALAKPTLLKITEEKRKDNITLHLFFDLTPKFSIKQSGRRIDLILDQALISDSILRFPADQNIVKFLPLVGEEKTVLSFFLRYTPQLAKASTGRDNSLILSIDLGDVLFKTHTDIVTDLEKSQMVDTKGNQYANPLSLSPYSHDWRLFFTRYESKVTIKVPVQFTLPPFPIIGLLPPALDKNLQLISPQLKDLASTSQWNAMEPLVADRLRIETDVEKKKLLALTYGEILLRAGNFPGAYKQLYLLEHSYPDKPISLFAGFLLARLQAEFEDPNLGYYKLKELSSSLQNDNPLTPYFLLLQIETALATNQLSQMNAFLKRDDIPFPKSIERIKELRQADYWYANNNPIKAFVGYQILDDQSLIEHHYYSLNGYCDTLYGQKHFQDAAKCYQKLAGHTTDKSQLGMVDYRRFMSELHFKRDYEMMTNFSTLADAFPGTDAGYKAALKRNDIRFLTKKNWEAGTSRSYKSIAEKATERDTSEEAAFKEALVYRLIGKNEKCVDLLMTFLRNYRSGDLIGTAQALLIDILPNELHRLVREKKYIEALVLAKQNDEFFKKKWLSIDLLADIALAYQKLGLYREAENTYLYLMELKGKSAERNFLFPLIQVLYRQGLYGAVDTYATQYSHMFPQGEDSREILLLHLQSLKNDNKLDQALSLLPTPLPNDLDLQELAAGIYFQKSDFGSVIGILAPLHDMGEALNDYSRFILAESFYKQGDREKAAGVYATLENAPLFQDQSLFRLADIALKAGQKEKAVKLLQQIVDKGKDTLWKSLAKKELEYENIVNNL
jgi:Tetratricopeptide repeat